MLLEKFWDKHRQEEFRGHVFVGPTDKTHCTSCDRGRQPLERGIGVHFIDEHGNEKFVTGPVCFEKHIDRDLSSIPVIGQNFSDVKTGKTHSIKVPKSLSATFQSLAANLSVEQQEAYANVMLRCLIMPKMGFNLRQNGLSKFLRVGLPYEPQTLIDIKRYVAIGENMRRPSLDQLVRAHYVANQISALLRKPLEANAKRFVESINQDLKDRFGLTDAQMEKLERTAKRYEILLQDAGIRFPENQRRLEEYRSQPRFER